MEGTLLTHSICTNIPAFAPIDKSVLKLHKFRSMIPRNAEKTLRKLVSQYPVVVCTGARQTGKTTLLKELFPEYTYVSLDLPSTAAMAEETPDAFFKKYPAPGDNTY